MLLVPILGTWLTWVVFADRMAGWVRLPYVTLVAFTLVIASAGVAVLAVMRSRVLEAIAVFGGYDGGGAFENALVEWEPN